MPLVLVVLVFAVYARVLGYPFIDYDDNTYVTHNPHLVDGLSVRGLQWAFSFSFYAGNWHPLTWLSHMLDYRLYGLSQPGGHHLTNLILHAANTILLFFVLRRMTGARFRSAIVAALFALHPLHVESVAWVAERKDVLSSFFWIATMGAYALYTERPNAVRYAGVLVALVLGLLAKPMLVTLPFVLLLMDYWPLRRLSSGWRPILLEKIPLFLLVGAASVVTVLAQRHGGTIGTLEQLSLGARTGNALVSYVAYLIKTAFPTSLAPLYPLRTTQLPAWEIVGSVLLLAAVSAGAFRMRKRHPYLLFGWLWYLGTLVPVIGFLHVGGQSMADRYTYMTLTGPFIAIAWGVSALFGQPANDAEPEAKRRSRSGAPEGGAVLPAILAAAAIAIAMALTWRQVSLWRDTYTLFRHTAQVTGANSIAENVLGSLLREQGNVDGAIQHLSRAIEIQPDFADAHNNLGLALIKKGDVRGAIQQYETAVRLEPGFAEAIHNLGMACYSEGDIDRAFRYCSQAIALDPALAEARNTMAAILWAQGKQEAAVASWNQAAVLRPDLAEPHRNLAIAFHSMRRYSDAWNEIRRYETLGGEPDSALIRDLSARMGSPSR